jgi:hypothetical protein
VCFFSFTWEEDAIIFFFHFFVFVWSEEDNTKMPLPFLFLLFFIMNKVTTTRLLLSQNFPFLPISPLLLTYFTSFCVHSIIKVWKSLKGEGRRGKAELGAKNRRIEVVAKRKRLKWKDKSKTVKTRR